MKYLIAIPMLMVGLAALAQHPEPQHSSPSQQMAPRANQGHRPPPPPARIPNAGGEQLGSGRINSTPHVNHNQWYGHDAPNDSRRPAWSLPSSWDIQRSGLPALLATSPPFIGLAEVYNEPFCTSGRT
jgi:hypothetical protein